MHYFIILIYKIYIFNIFYFLLFFTHIYLFIFILLLILTYLHIFLFITGKHNILFFIFIVYIGFCYLQCLFGFYRVCFLTENAGSMQPVQESNQSKKLKGLIAAISSSIKHNIFKCFCSA